MELSRIAKVKLKGSMFSWLEYAELVLTMPTNKASLMWYNEHYTGKYLLCEARKDGATRLFIRNTTNSFADTLNKSGWWDTFTVTKTPVHKGIWLCRINHMRNDRKGYLNQEVETVLPINDVKFHTLFDFSSTNGTWNSVAWWLMIVCSNLFLDKYNFETTSRNPNIEALREAFPEDLKETVSYKEVGKIMLFKYLRNEVTLEKIEECLNTPTEWESFVIEVQTAVARHTVEEKFSKSYPLFAKKVRNNTVDEGDLFVRRDNVESYLIRQLDSYYMLVKTGKLPVVNDLSWLDQIEAVLKYRKALKDEEKRIKREQRKQKNGK